MPGDDGWRKCRVGRAQRAPPFSSFILSPGMVDRESRPGQDGRDERVAMVYKNVRPVVLLWLVAAAVMLPITICVLVGLGRLLGGMGDAAGSLVLERIGLALGIAWVLDLVFLVLWLAIQRLLECGGPPETGEEP